MNVAIQVTLNNLPGLAGQLDSTIEGALDAGVVAALATADQLARRDTGAMVANKTIERGPGSRMMTWNEEHAVYNEFGTVRMSAQPFAAPGADAAVPVIEAHLGRFGR